MKHTVLVTLLSLAVPAVASADPWREPCPPAVDHDARRDVAELRALVARYDAAVARGDRPELARLEAAMLRAVDEEIGEARAALRTAPRGHAGHPGDRRLEQARGELHRLEALRADFTSLQGRFGWRATQRKRAVVVEVTELARADVARGAIGPREVAFGHR